MSLEDWGRGGGGGRKLLKGVSLGLFHLNIVEARDRFVGPGYTALILIFSGYF